MTSSTVASNVCGIVRPSAAAPAELAQMRDESGGPRPPYGRIRTQYSDEPLLFRLLRVGGQGPSAETKPQAILMKSRRFMACLPDEGHFRHSAEYQIAAMAVCPWSQCRQCSKCVRCRQIYRSRQF